MSSKITLKSSHINLVNELVVSIFGDIDFAYVTYIKEQNTILITPITSVWFVKMYKPSQFLLKSRNLNGDKTLAVREILLDNDVDTTDRNLKYEIIEKTNLIKVYVE